jgi:hypothetical protein
VANFAVTGSRSGPAPLTVTFVDKSTGPVESYAWSFGDGGTSSEQSPQHTFTEPGTYEVELVVTNATSTSSATTTITAEEPSPSPSATPGPIVPDEGTGGIPPWLLLLVLLGGGGLLAAAVVLARRRSAAATWWSTAAALQAEGRRFVGQLGSRLDPDPASAAAAFVALEASRAELGGHLDELKATAPDEAARGLATRAGESLGALGVSLDAEAAVLRGSAAATPDQVAFMRATTDERAAAFGVSLDGLARAGTSSGASGGA